MIIIVVADIFYIYWLYPLGENNNFYQQGSWWTASSVAQKRPAPVRNAQRHWVWPTLTSKVCNTNTSMQLKTEAVPFLILDEENSWDQRESW